MHTNNLVEKLVGSEDERAVSPVIGVILMVAITVILAAVIAAFVLDIGPGDTDPTAAVSIDGDNTENVDIELVSIDQGDGIAVLPNDDGFDDDALDDISIGDEDNYIASNTVSGSTINLNGSDSDQFDEDEGDVSSDTYEFTVIAYDGEDPEDLVNDLDSDLEGDEIISALDDEDSINFVIEEDFDIEVTDQD